MVPCADMPSLPTPAGLMESVRSYYSIDCGLPRNRGGSAPALTFSRPAQRSLTLRPACSPSRLNDLLHQRLQQSRCLHRCSDCYRVERTSSRAGLTPAVDHHLFTAHAVLTFTRSMAYTAPVAIWQFRVILIPEQILLSKYEVLPAAIPMELAEDFAWWADVQPASGFEQQVGVILPQMESWSSSMRMWGLNNADEAWVVYTDEDKKIVEEITFHVDVSDVSPEYVRQICVLARELGCVLLTREYEILVPDEGMVLASINNSTAKRFVNDPIATLKSLDQSEIRKRLEHFMNDPEDSQE